MLLGQVFVQALWFYITSNHSPFLHNHLQGIDITCATNIKCLEFCHSKIEKMGAYVTSFCGRLKVKIILGFGTHIRWYTSSHLMESAYSSRVYYFNINSCLFFPHDADIFVLSLSKHLAQTLPISRRQRKATHQQTQENYKWLILCCQLYTVTSGCKLGNFKHLTALHGGHNGPT